MSGGAFPADAVAWVRAWASSRLGLDIPPDRPHLLEDRLEQVCRESQLSPRELVTALGLGEEGVTAACVDALTTHETQWFRDVGAFAALTGEVIPSLLEASSRPLTVWSAACSSGQELYSVAMALEEQFPGLWRDRRVSLLGSDVSPGMVARASAGAYTQREVDRGLPARHLVGHFRREGLWWRVNDDLRERCRFFVHNLVLDPPPAMCDVILCRYVAIYFDPVTRVRVLSQLARSLSPGGVLMLGAGEMMGSSVPDVRRVVVGSSAFFVQDPAPSGGS